MPQTDIPHRAVPKRTAIGEGMQELAPDPPTPDEESVTPPGALDAFAEITRSPPQPQVSMEVLRTQLKSPICYLVHEEEDYDDEGGRHYYFSLSLHALSGLPIQPEDAGKHFIVNEGQEAASFIDSWRLDLLEVLKCDGSAEPGEMKTLYPAGQDIRTLLSNGPQAIEAWF